MPPTFDKNTADLFTIRPYTQADWPAVCRIHDAARIQELAAGNVDPRAFRTMIEAAARDEFFDSETVVACLGDAVVGFVSWNGAYLSWLYVEPAAQRRGIGGQLLQHALQRIGPEAWTNTLADNSAARTLYQRAGFEVVWIRPLDCDGFPCDAMRLALPTSRMRNPEAKRQPPTSNVDSHSN
jgi:ribosomal protein S18 acetylase RimI-like enzyme